MSVWGSCSSACLTEAASTLGVLVGVLLLGLAAMLGAAWTRAQVGRRFERRISQVYEAIRAKAQAARDADYQAVPVEAFALYHALREELFDLAGVGAAVQTLKDAVVRAASQPSAPTVGQLARVKGAAVGPLPQPSDSAPPDAVDLHADLRQAVRDFWDYWSHRQRVEQQLRQIVRNLGGELALPEARPARPRYARFGLMRPGSAREGGEQTSVSWRP